MEIFNTTWKILIPIFRRPTVGLTIRDISREAGISHPTVSRIVKALEAEKVVLTEKRKNQILVKGNFDNERFLELKRMYNILSLKPFIEEITQRYPVDVIICFGSYSLGRDTENSDIDLYIGYRKISLSKSLIEKFERRLHRKIQIFSGKLEEFPRELIENIINGVKLYGWIRIW